MRQKNLDNSYLSALCLELSLFLHAGITLSDGLYLLIEDDDDIKSREIISGLAKRVDQNRPLSEAMEEMQLFPSYMVKMILIGEKTGRLSDTLKSLSEYYESQKRLSITIKNALFYPAILLVMMIAVIVILITVVLPIFNDVFNQLGSQLPPFTETMMNIGTALSNASLFFIILAAVLVLTGIILLLSPRLRTRCAQFYSNLRGERGLASKISLARFSNALSMSLKSGLDMKESFNMASTLSPPSKINLEKYRICAQYLDAGSSLTDALKASDIFPSMYCRMLTMGAKSGNMDTVMSEISRRSENSVNDAIESRLGRIEPTLVIITSLIVGVILLSVMLPLINIMSSMG